MPSSASLSFASHHALKPLPQPIFVLHYEKKNVTKEALPYILSVSYRDQLFAAGDTLTVQLEDPQECWISKWYPGKGRRVSLQIGSMVECVGGEDFEIAELRLNQPPSTLTIEAHATVCSKLRWVGVSQSYEQTYLSKIVYQIAQRHHLTVVGKISDIDIDFVMQYHESDMDFLKRLAQNYGHIFKVVGKKLVFTSLYDLCQADIVSTLKKTSIKHIELSDKSEELYKNTRLSYHNPSDKKLTTAAAVDHNRKSHTNASGAFNFHLRAGSQANASAQANAALLRADLQHIGGKLSVLGNPKLIAGNSFQIPDLGYFSGKYLIVSSHHYLNRKQGYVTDIEVQRID